MNDPGFLSFCIVDKKSLKPAHLTGLGMPRCGPGFSDIAKISASG